MIVYIDSDYKCHAEPAEGLRAVEDKFFDGKCSRFIEGYRFVPQGETWVSEDGEEFSGNMITPHEDYAILDAAQQQYEEMIAEIAEREAALAIMGVSLDE